MKVNFITEWSGRKLNKKNIEICDICILKKKMYIYYEKESVLIFRTKLIGITLENVERRGILRNWMYKTKILTFLNDANINM